MGDEFFDDSKAAKKHNRQRELELLSIHDIMKTENGRRFMYRCLQNCCTFENIFNEDPIRHALNAGKREHGLWLNREILEADKDNYFRMLKENHNE